MTHDFQQEMYPRQRKIPAYVETEYLVHYDPPFALRIGDQSPGLLSLFGKTNALCAAFLTAYKYFNTNFRG
jgi:hypothetical protein